ncbi:hypothetical protein K1719_007350 [Acacia pycnantha]|nr:hypothetical protein K1719_007350 [Acacia pycnantha]
MEEEKKQSRRTVIFNKYEMGRLLGQGNFAKVYYGRNLETHESVAIKNGFNDIMHRQLGLSIDDVNGLVYAFDGNEAEILPASGDGVVL